MLRRPGGVGYDEVDAQTLGGKLEALDLNAGETAALHAVLSFAAQYPDDLQGLDRQTPGNLAAVLQRVLFEPVPV